jgi:hypothetical protein
MITYADGRHIQLRDVVQYAGRIGEVENIFMPGCSEGPDYECADTGGILVRMRDDGDFFILIPSQAEDLELVSRSR